VGLTTASMHIRGFVGLKTIQLLIGMSAMILQAFLVLRVHLQFFRSPVTTFKPNKMSKLFVKQSMKIHLNKSIAKPILESQLKNLLLWRSVVFK